MSERDQRVYFFGRDDVANASLQGPQIGDVLRYDKETAFMHVAVVTAVIGSEIAEVRSKWAGGPALLHEPLDLLEASKVLDHFNPRRDQRGDQSAVWLASRTHS